MKKIEEKVEANFRALYHSTLVRIAKHELGVDIEKSSRDPIRYQAIRFMLTNHPNISIRRPDWFHPAGLLSILAMPE